MSYMSLAYSDRMWELLADRAIFGLTDRENDELNEFLAICGTIDAEDMDRTAALVDLALSEGMFDRLPTLLYETIREQRAALV